MLEQGLCFALSTAVLSKLVCTILGTLGKDNTILEPMHIGFSITIQLLSFQNCMQHLQFDYANHKTYSGIDSTHF